MEIESRRLTCLRAALAFLQLRGNAPELVLLYRWLDLWVGIGGHEGHEGIRAAGTAQASPPWGAVQWAAWAALSK